METRKTVLKEFMELGDAVLQYEKEYGRYDFAMDRINKSMIIDRKNSTVMVIGVYAIHYLGLEAEAFLADIQREWKNIEFKIECNIVNGIEPNIDSDALESLQGDEVFV